MKIEKKKVTGNAKLSATEKGAIASVLGMAATFSLTACISGAESGEVIGPIEYPESSNDAEILQSSSSQVDIPKSNEALSSSAIEALSSVAGPLSSSSAAAPASSDTAPTSSVASETAPSSSSISEMPEIRVETVEPDIIIEPQSSPSERKKCGVNDPSCTPVCDSRVEICFERELPVMSMVTTFETTDLEA